MPANLPLPYFEAEKKLRAAKEPAEKIEALEEMLAIMPHHKGTDHLRAELRRKIARISEEMDKKLATQKVSIHIQKEGAAQVVIIGMPSAGKSQFLCATTNARPTVADYPFTTQHAMPGMMPFEDIQIQLIDTPPITKSTMEWWLPHAVRRADAMLIMADLSLDPVAEVKIISEQLLKHKIGLGGSGVVDEDDSIYYQNTLIAGNKIDLPDTQENLAALKAEYVDKMPVASISALTGTGIEDLKHEIFRLLDVIRVYTKAPGQKADRGDPVVLDSGSTVEDAAVAVHKSFLERLKYARVWGSGKHDGLRVKRDHVLQEGDVIEFHL
jgi:uncharacterized protein